MKKMILILLLVNLISCQDNPEKIIKKEISKTKIPAVVMVKLVKMVKCNFSQKDHLDGTEMIQLVKKIFSKLLL